MLLFKNFYIFLLLFRDLKRKTFSGTLYIPFLWWFFVTENKGKRMEPKIKNDIIDE